MIESWVRAGGGAAGFFLLLGNEASPRSDVTDGVRAVSRDGDLRVGIRPMNL